MDYYTFVLCPEGVACAFVHVCASDRMPLAHEARYCLLSPVTLSIDGGRQELGTCNQADENIVGACPSADTVPQVCGCQLV